jgi:hypothetical protein
LKSTRIPFGLRRPRFSGAVSKPWSRVYRKSHPGEGTWQDTSPHLRRVYSKLRRGRM